MLKPALARGEIQCIGATTLDEYRKYIEKDGALERRFQPVMVDPPIDRGDGRDPEGPARALRGAPPGEITDDAIDAAVELSERYITDRFLPDKAIDVIDEAGARAAGNAGAAAELKELEEELEKVNRRRTTRSAQDFEKAAPLRDKERELQNDDKLKKLEWERDRQTDRR